MNDALTDLVRDINMLRNQVISCDTIIHRMGHNVFQSQKSIISILVVGWRVFGKKQLSS